MIEEGPVLVRATLASTLHLRARWDPNGRRRCWARSGGWALEHVERELDEGWRGALPQLRATLALPEGAAQAADALISALDRVGAQATQRGALPEGVQPPAWPLEIRRGALVPPWPFDAELAGLELGLRRVIKRQPRSARERDEDAAWLSAHGLEVREVEGTLLGARDRESLAEAMTLEHMRGDDEAAHALGALLGYPSCCIEAFTRLGARDDATLLAIRAGAAPPELGFLLAPLALFSHTPCEARCERTLTLARSVLAYLDATRPGFADAWRSLAAALHVVDHRGRALVLDARDEGEEIVVHRARELSVPALQTVPELAGVVLRRSGPFVRSPPTGWTGCLLADHRDERKLDGNR